MRKKDDEHTLRVSVVRFLPEAITSPSSTITQLPNSKSKKDVERSKIPIHSYNTVSCNNTNIRKHNLSDLLMKLHISYIKLKKTRPCSNELQLVPGFTIASVTYLSLMVE